MIRDAGINQTRAEEEELFSGERIRTRAQKETQFSANSHVGGEGSGSSATEEIFVIWIEI